MIDETFIYVVSATGAVILFFIWIELQLIASRLKKEPETKKLSQEVEGLDMEKSYSKEELAQAIKNKEKEMGQEEKKIKQIKKVLKKWK